MRETPTELCDRCEEQRETTKLLRNGRIWAAVCDDCHDALAEEVANPTTLAADGGEDGAK